MGTVMEPVVSTLDLQVGDLHLLQATHTGEFSRISGRDPHFKDSPKEASEFWETATYS